ncbi:hypothetical protein AMC99_02160 [Altererythrobacter epoxidivorans]|uniref:Uncharacterized protein n=1 Tax=Altererythrobacter epoxidivorans TaxID=361183 RepID=A0A0M4M9E4_9SPHN|nr:hypothetical protein AMC99_02160 [Altererythrobacter epoxidivorans]
MGSEPAIEGDLGEEQIGQNLIAERLVLGLLERLDDGELQPLADAHMRCISSGFYKGVKVFVDIALKGKPHGVT